MTTVVRGGRSRGRNGWLAVGGAFTALTIAAGGLSVAGWLGFRSEIQDHTYRQQVTRILLDVATGDLTLTPGEAGTVAVRRRLFWSYTRPTIHEEWDGSTLRVTARCPVLVSVGPGCGVDYTLAVPDNVVVEARTSTGNISTRQVLGDLRLTASTGNITVVDAAGRLSLHTSTGDITASGRLTAAEVEATTSTGDVHIRFAEPPRTVTASASTGDIRVLVPAGEAYRVRAAASTGDVRVGVRRNDEAARSLLVRTSTGDVDIAYG